MVLKLSSIFACWWKYLMVATSRFGLLTIRWHSAATSRYQVRSEKTKKGYTSTLITATTNSVYLPKLVSSNLTIKSDLVLINPIGKNGLPTRCPPTPPPFQLRGGIEPPTKFSKRGALTGPQLWKEVTGKEEGNFFQRGCNFYKKNQLKSKLFNDKKSL